MNIKNYKKRKKRSLEKMWAGRIMTQPMDRLPHGKGLPDQNSGLEEGNDKTYN